MLSILVFLLVAALLIATAILFYAVGAGKTMAKVVKDLRAELNDLKSQWDMYGGDVGITAVYKELEQAKRERNAAQALLAEISGVTGSAPITTAFGVPLERIRELVEADIEGRCVVQEFAPGDEVWVVERDEDGNASEVSGFIFVASVNGVAIVSPSINDCSDIDFILSDFVEETATEFSGSLSGYPIFDCYKSRGEAKAALKARE